MDMLNLVKNLLEQLHMWMLSIRYITGNVGRKPWSMVMWTALDS